MTNNLVPLIEGLIRGGRHRWLSSMLLESGYWFSRATFWHSLERLVLRGKMLQLNQRADMSSAARLILTYSKRHALTWPLLRDFIDEGGLPYASTLLEGRSLSPEFESALRGLKLRADGKLEEAIAEISSINSDVFAFKQFRTDTLRNLYHQQQNHENIAQLLVDFTRSEPDRILIKQAIGACASSEAANRDELFAIAAMRILADLEKIKASDRLFKRYWKDAVEGMLSTFDVDGAIQIASEAENRGYKVKNVLSDLLSLQEDIAPIASVVRRAHSDFLSRCGQQTLQQASGEVVIIFPAAALRKNKIDYPTFRRDIRLCIKEIVHVLQEDNISFSVKSRIRTHGLIALDRPYFSYHTVANDQDGLHFKETDRPSLFSFDDRGYAGWSHFSRTEVPDLHLDQVDLPLATAFFDSDKARVIGSRLSKYTQVDVAEQLPKRFVFVALQVVGDAVQSLAYATPFAMLDEVIRVAKSFGRSVVVKRHPACRSPQITQYLSEHSHELTLSTGNIHDIIPASDAVCVINSGVGAEALLYEKPVYVFGGADYMNACFVCSQTGDFEKNFLPGATRLSSDDLRRFWYIYRNVYACDLKDEEHARTWIGARVRSHIRKRLST